MSLNPNLQGAQEAFTSYTPRTIASAASISPVTAISFITGTTSIATIVPPVNAPHTLTFIFTNAAPGAFLTSGNIGAAVTPIQNTAVVLAYDPITGKYYPASTSGTSIGSYGYQVQVAAAGVGTFNPADASTYFIGSFSQVAPDSSELVAPVVLTAGVITKASLSAVVGGTVGSTETFTVSARNVTQNQTATISTLAVWNTLGPVTVSNASMNLAVAAGDRVGIRIVTPTWGTNPTSVFLFGSLWIATTNA